MTRVAILQSNYIPWRGYFDLISKVDEFVIYDTCQYTVNDWRNRNQVKTRQGLVWLTIPVLTKGRTGQLIDEAQFEDRSWVKKHVKTIEQVLGRSPHFDVVQRLLADAFAEVGDTRRLHDVNVTLIRALSDALALDTRITLDRDHGELDGSPSDQVAELAHRVGATSYLTGPRGLDYLEVGPFAERGIELEVIDYSSLDEYPQMFGDFAPTVSVLDLLANCGPDASQHFTSTLRRVEMLDGRPVVGGVVEPTGPDSRS